jgi:molybdate transport system substrate-binding protein
MFAPSVHRPAVRQYGSMTSRLAHLATLMILAAPVTSAEPATLRVFTTRAIATVLEQIGPQVELDTGCQLEVVVDIAIRLVRRIENGEHFDVLVASPEHVNRLAEEGKILRETRVDLARSGIGIEVRAGAPHPDISSVEAFKCALLGAESIAYLKEGQSGVYLAGLMDRLGLAEAIESKLTRPETDIVSELVAKGEVELGMVVVTQILTTHGVSLVGPLPAEIQKYITFAAGVSSTSSRRRSAERLLEILAGPVAAPVMRLQGMEPASVKELCPAQ